MKNLMVLLVTLMAFSALPTQAQGDTCGELVYVYNEELYRGDEAIAALPGFNFTHEADPQNEWVVFTNVDEDLYRVRLDGTDFEQLTNTSDLREWYIDWSPDGEYVAWIADVNDASENQIFVMDRAGEVITQVSNEHNSKGIVDWSGEWLYYNVGTSDGSELHRVRADGSDSSLITASPEEISYLGYTMDWVFYAVNVLDQPTKIYRAPYAGGGAELIYEGILDTVFSVSLRSDEYLYFRAYVPNRTQEAIPNSHVFRLDADGSGLVQITNFDAEIEDARWGRDRETIIVEQGVMEMAWNDIFLISLDGSEITTISKGSDYFRTWDGDAAIVDRVLNPGINALFRIDDTGDEERLTTYQGNGRWVGCSD